MEEDHGVQGVSLALDLGGDGSEQKLHAFEPAIEQQSHADGQTLNNLPDSLQLIADEQQVHIRDDSDTQTPSGVVSNDDDAVHFIHTSRSQHSVAQQTLADDGCAQHHQSIENNVHGHTNQLPQHPQIHPQLHAQQQQHLLQPFIPLPPQLPQFQIQQRQSANNNNNHMIESRNGQLHTILPSAPPHEQQQQQPLPQTLAPNFSNPPSLEAPSQPATTTQRKSYFNNMKRIPNPPDLRKWREKLFDVEETIVLSEDEFQIYFPHVDNVYSHRSTQKYKRKPFISHYWDCRLKGRPPGTPKSHDPNKKKRKRVARERNLCDVKIKITEYFPSAMNASPGLQAELEALSSAHAAQQQRQQQHQHQQTREQTFDQTTHGGIPGCAQPFGVLTPSTTFPAGHPGAGGARYYTIQRVNGNGGNGRSDSIGGPHRHTLEESDRVKKNSVQRSLLKEEKEKKNSALRSLLKEEKAKAKEKENRHGIS